MLSVSSQFFFLVCLLLHLSIFGLLLEYLFFWLVISSNVARVSTQTGDQQLCADQRTATTTVTTAGAVALADAAHLLHDVVLEKLFYYLFIYYCIFISIN